MKKYNSFFFVLFLMLSAITAIAQDGEMNEEQKAWMEYMTPGETHAMMAKSAGKWKSKMLWWSAPGTEPMASEVSTVNEMILGGRYLQSKHSGTTMGMPFEGIGIEGYDNIDQIFTNVWIDNMGTGIATSKGKYDPATKTITYTGKMMDPNKRKFIDYKQTLKFINDDEQLYEMYYGDAGNEFKTMEIVSKRVK